MNIIIPDLPAPPNINTPLKKIFNAKWISLFAIFIILFISLDMIHVYYHEHAHGAIYDAYNVKYTYGWDMEGIAIGFFTQTNDSRNCDVICESLQIENEIYSYNQAYIFYSLWMILFVYLVKCFFDDSMRLRKND